jgi:hypothetical protein
MIFHYIGVDMAGKYQPDLHSILWVFFGYDFFLTVSQAPFPLAGAVRVDIVQP